MKISSLCCSALALWECVTVLHSPTQHVVESEVTIATIPLCLSSIISCSFSNTPHHKSGYNHDIRFLCLSADIHG